jgi:tryptophan halogenase
VPDSLAERLALFRESGYAYMSSDDLFSVTSWVFVMVGQRLMPRQYPSDGCIVRRAARAQALETLKRNIARGVSGMPLHKDYLRTYCPAERPVAEGDKPNA